MQIRYTIFSRLLCVRHLQTILPYSPYLYGIFTIYSNFTPHTRIYFCKAESFFAELELTFSIHPFVNLVIFCPNCSNANSTEIRNHFFIPEFPAFETSSHPSSGHLTLIHPAAAGKLTTEPRGRAFRRQFLPIS